MRRFLRNRVVEWTLAAIGAYWLFAFLIPKMWLLEGINGVLAATSATVSIIYLRAVWQQMRKVPYNLEGGHLIIFGIAGFFLMINFLFIWAWLFTALGQPDGMRMNLINYWFRWGALVFTVMLMLASDVIDERSHVLPGLSLKQIAFILAGGLIIATTVITLTGEPLVTTP